MIYSEEQLALQRVVRRFVEVRDQSEHGYPVRTRPVLRRFGSIGGGADEVMLSIICKLLGILPKKRKER